MAVAVATAGESGGSAAREAEVARRGAAVMPFDLDATTHVFTPTPTGGVQQVVADDPSDAEQVALVREHLRAEVARFRRGDFGDPAAIHGHDMPGLAVLEARAGTLTVEFRGRDDGGEVTFRSGDPVTVDALHDWFGAQLADHGEHAERGHPGA
jgi:hypothetical protein